jgi:hypothetical protein
MSGLGRRLAALEQVAERARRREVRDFLAALPEARGLTPAEIDEATATAIASLDAFEEQRRRGMSEQQIIRRYAERIAAERGETADRVLEEAGLDPATYR